MTLKYESEILYGLMKRDGDDSPSDVLPYESELKEKYLNQVTGAYPKLQDYRPEWLNYNLYKYLPADFPVESVSNVTEASFQNVVPYAFKSAILKGQTLVNLVKPHKALETYYKVGTSTSFQQILVSLIRPLEPNKTYTIQMNITETNGNVAFQSIVIGKGTSGGDSWGYRLYTGDFTNQTKNVGITKCVFTTPSYVSETNLSHIIFISERYNIDATIEKIMIVEGDHTQEDIPYFTGMQSVKMPVLTTIGKNLFNLPLVQGSQTYTPIGGKPIHEIRSNRVTNEPNKYIKVKPNTQITFSIINNDVRFAIAELDEHGNRLGDTGWLETVSQKTITTKSSTHYIGFNFKKVGDTDITVEEVINSNPMFEYSNTSTSYEPYKTNILTVNEDVTLRSNGNVYDELDLLTGKLTQRIDEDGEVLAKEVIKTVDLTCTNEQGETIDFMPIEGTMSVKTSSDTIPSLLDMEVPVEAITQNLKSFASMEE